MIRNDSEDAEESRLEESFEEGVMHVQDELESDPYLDQDDDNGYDLLPLPVPAPERQILNVSEAKRPEWNQKETRFRYGSPNLQEGISIDSPEDEKRVFLGEMAIDENIDKLREVIGSVDNILSRCAASSGGIERSRRHKLSLHLDILRGLDSWEGLRGKFVSQRALLKGLSGIEQSKEVFEESDLALVDGEFFIRLLIDSTESLRVANGNVFVFLFDRYFLADRLGPFSGVSSRRRSFDSACSENRKQRQSRSH